MSGWEKFEDLYGRHSRTVYRRALQLVGDADAARDVTQEVFMRVVRAGGSAPAEPTVTAWLYRVTTNICLNRLRDSRRQRALLASQAGGDVTGARATGATGEARVGVAQILGRVPEELQEVAVYFFLDELTYDEMAPLLGVSRRTVSNRLAAFRKLVAEMFPGERLAS